MNYLRNTLLLILLPVLFIGSASAAAAATIGGELLKVEWHGADRIAKSVRQSSFPLQIGDDIDSNRLQQALATCVERLIHTGFPAIRLDSALWLSKKYGGDLRLYWSHAVPVNLQSLRSAADTLEWVGIDTSKNAGFDAAQIVAVVDDWLDNKARKGYPLASVTIDSGSIREDSSAVRINLVATPNQGNIVTINDLSVPGGEGIRPELWRRESRLHFPSRYNPDRITRARRYLLSTERFDDLGNPGLVKMGPVTMLQFSGRIKYPTQIDGAVGYVPARGTEKGTVTGRIHLSMGQLFHSFRRLTVDWSRPDRKSQDFSFRYLEPWLFQVPVSLELSGAIVVRDTLYSELRGEARGVWQYNEYWSVGVGSFFREISADSAAQQVLGFSQIGATGISLSATFDNRDRPANPYQGLLGSVNWEWSKQQRSDALREHAELRKLTLTLEQSVPMARHYSLLLGVRGGELESTDPAPPLPDLFTVGGPGTVRGYREKEFYATRYAIGTIEPRWLILSTSRAYLFTDIGFLERTRDSLRTQTTVAGWGAGMLIGLKSSRIGFDLGWGRFDSPLDGKVSFRIIQEF